MKEFFRFCKILDFPQNLLFFDTILQIKLNFSSIAVGITNFLLENLSFTFDSRCSIIGA